MNRSAPKRYKRSTARRGRQGASIILVVVLAFLLVGALYFGFKYALMLGGSSELRNAVDAAALNVSKRVCQLKVPPEGVYGDCVDTTGQVGLANINRVWGKALLINANAQSMAATGTAGQDTATNADQAFRQAQTINDALGSQLKNKGVLDTYFNQVASSRPAKMLGNDAAVQTDANSAWATSMVDRGAESNLAFSKPQIPQGVTVQAAGKYLSGYTAMTANNKHFCFVSFRPNEMPHLISDTTFDQNRGDTSPIQNIANPLPNAFRETGHVDSANAALAAAASAVANPLKQYSLSVPHCYVKLQFGNLARWFVEGKMIKTTPYTGEPATQWGVKQYVLPPPNGGKLDGWATLGNEYKRGSVWAVINTLPGDHTVFLAPMLQRIQEINPNYTTQQLTTLLNGAPVDPEATTYYIYPVYSTQDLTDPQIRIASQNGSLPGWLNKQAPDGIDLSLGKEPPLENGPNINWENIVGGKSANGKHWVTMWGQVAWQPGTGFAGCLGVLKFAHYSDCYFTGEP